MPRGGIPPCGERCQTDSHESHETNLPPKTDGEESCHLKPLRKSFGLVSIPSGRWNRLNNSRNGVNLLNHSMENVTYVIVWFRPRRRSCLWLKSFPESGPCKWWCHFAPQFVGRRFWAAMLRWPVLHSICALETSQTQPCSAARPAAPEKISNKKDI